MTFKSTVAQNRQTTTDLDMNLEGECETRQSIYSVGTFKPNRLSKPLLPDILLTHHYIN